MCCVYIKACFSDKMRELEPGTELLGSCTSLSNHVRAVLRYSFAAKNATENFT
jgi:hypothetical protein